MSRRFIKPFGDNLLLYAPEKRFLNEKIFITKDKKLPIVILSLDSS